jgi:hypothetical protein
LKTFLIQFFAWPSGWPDGAPRGAAFMDLDIAENVLRALVEATGGNPDCRHCRGFAVAEKIRDLAYAQRIAPAGNLEAVVHDVSGDQRVVDYQKRRLLDQDAMTREIASETETSGRAN